MKKNYAIILAAGKGTRMKSSINKQFLNIDDKPVLYYSLHKLSKNKFIDGMILVCGEDKINYCRKNVIEKFKIEKVVDVVKGGDERQDSVLNGLNAVPNHECNIVLIHDGARPFIEDSVIENGIKYAEKYGSCACGVPPKDTIKIIDKTGFSVDTIDRSKLFCVQTPQCFDYNLILKCHRKLKLHRVKFTDDTAVVEYYGNKVYLYSGSYDNIKITTPEDLITADSIIRKRK
ncbi:2-C-methyl-D-erythritol 4-phosphate cytidylyltransferase [Clostridium sp. JN-1]|jgi:2-C-methyl-D-erythritol 4-phosphate cytidylyltransferase|uniref:2-C-methyl-D-erythritol 4-phosphate cytidylyltransferase n=1 Tax=Clostridium sp. JN-1 TaxID=2483110 RepID=UPI000F0AFFDB|nr:2-C-methyl-D-erythritol 4-phosphate cytidylyltransferase [Clostridium sp. JN-1]